MSAATVYHIPLPMLFSHVSGAWYFDFRPTQTGCGFAGSAEFVAGSAAGFPSVAVAAEFIASNFAVQK